MKILWLGGIILPRIARKEGLPINNMNGWLIKTSENLPEGYNLTYVFDSDRPIEGSTNYYSYYGIKCDAASARRFGREYINAAKDILNKERPDVIHIWGTEGSHSLAMVEACEELGLIDSVVISIQGLVSAYAEHYTAYLPATVVSAYTLRDVLKGNVKYSQKIYYKRGLLEQEAIRKVKHVIGRTEWDRACVWGINPNVVYHFNNETLRDEFYTGMWEYEKCEKHSIFCSQGHYPIKGLHLMLKALPRIIVEYPDTHLYVGGKDYRAVTPIKQGAYGLYILYLIKKYNLENHVSFTGVLNAEKMKKRYLDSNVFVSASAIENSPNSLGEAMLLGVPCVSSRVGGTHNMLKHGEEGYLYPADETYMLSYYVCKIFENPNVAKKMADNARLHAELTHSSKNNMEKLIEIYTRISGKE